MELSQHKEISVGPSVVLLRGVVFHSQRSSSAVENELVEFLLWVIVGRKYWNRDDGWQPLVRVLWLRARSRKGWVGSWSGLS